MSLIVFLFFLLFVTGDTLLSRVTNLKGLYYLFHFIHNVAISFLTFHNVVESFDMKRQAGGYLNDYVLPLIYSLHCYHIVSYSNYFRSDDWMHHILSMGVAVPLTLWLFPSKNLLGFSFFFTTGIPGGINYLNLFLYKNDWMTKQKQQRINVFISSWIRCPGIVMNCAFILQYLYNSQLSFLMNFYGLVTFAILFWNGVYFQNIVLKSFFSKFK
jgi:hypothetical protein